MANRKSHSSSNERIRVTGDQPKYVAFPNPQHHVYGHMPPPPPSYSRAVIREIPDCPYCRDGTHTHEPKKPKEEKKVNNCGRNAWSIFEKVLCTPCMIIDKGCEVAEAGCNKGCEFAAAGCKVVASQVDHGFTMCGRGLDACSYACDKEIKRRLAKCDAKMTDKCKPVIERQGRALSSPKGRKTCPHGRPYIPVQFHMTPLEEAKMQHYHNHHQQYAEPPPPYHYPHPNDRRQHYHQQYYQYPPMYHSYNHHHPKQPVREKVLYDTKHSRFGGSRQVHHPTSTSVVSDIAHLRLIPS